MLHSIFKTSTDPCSQLTYPLGVAIGIACAGAILGEAGCLRVFSISTTSEEMLTRTAFSSNTASPAG
jgi:hypothetical protein